MQITTITKVTKTGGFSLAILKHANLGKWNTAFYTHLLRCKKYTAFHIIGHHRYSGMKDSEDQLKCWDTPLSCFKSLLVTGLGDIILTSLLPSIHSCCPMFWAWSCIASNFDEGRRGDHRYKIVGRPFKPKYGTVSHRQVFLQLVVACPSTKTTAYFTYLIIVFAGKNLSFSVSCVATVLF